MQLGGKFDVVAIVVSLALHAQLRQHQGLLTYLLFADLKYAFDVADWNLMSLSCYSAGVVGKEWMLLDDLFTHGKALKPFALPQGGSDTSGWGLYSGTSPGKVGSRRFGFSAGL